MSSHELNAHVQPIAHKVAQNLDIISGKFQFITRRTGILMWFIISTMSLRGTNRKSHEQNSSTNLRNNLEIWHSFGHNLEILCHLMCNWLYMCIKFVVIHSYCTWLIYMYLEILCHLMCNWLYMCIKFVITHSYCTWLIYMCLEILCHLMAVTRLSRVLFCCGVLQCVAVCCSVLQCVAVRCSVFVCALFASLRVIWMSQRGALYVILRIIIS